MADLKINLTVSDTNQLILKNDILDIDEWVQNALIGKQNKCWERLRAEWSVKLIDDPSFTDPIPSNKDDFVKLVTNRADYKDRAARDAESQPG